MHSRVLFTTEKISFVEVPCCLNSWTKWYCYDLCFFFFAPINTQAPWRCGSNFRDVFFKPILCIDILSTFCEQSHCLSQCWPSSMSPSGVTSYVVTINDLIEIEWSGFGNSHMSLLKGYSFISFWCQYHLPYHVKNRILSKIFTLMCASAIVLSCRGITELIGFSDAKWRHRSGSTLAPIMAFCYLIYHQRGPMEFIEEHFHKEIWEYPSVNQDLKLHFEIAFISLLVSQCPNGILSPSPYKNHRVTNVGI